MTGTDQAAPLMTVLRLIPARSVAALPLFSGAMKDFPSMLFSPDQQGPRTGPNERYTSYAALDKLPASRSKV
ncbi:hypothetical protein [Microbacterium azadirachtae]|uniref:hypothetical protein n=1 Tax=Microbacterium azadirachtae TaxID=582680 RepID=UPI00190FE76D|nr:hypothetical protein [Microbacterium azadirachtae]